MIHNQQQACLTSTSQPQPQPSPNHLPLIHQLATQSKMKNICLAIIILIIMANYRQVDQLKANYHLQENVLATLIKSMQENKQQLQVYKKESQVQQVEASNKIKQQLQDINKRLSQRLQLLEQSQARQKQKISTIQQSINKFSSQLSKQEHLASIGRQADVEVVAKADSIYLSFLMDHTKEEYHYKKMKWLQSLLESPFLSQSKVKESFLTALNNVQLPHSNIITQKYINSLQQSIHTRLSQQYHLSQYPKQLPFCIVVPTFNNAKDYRYEYNLQSILNLNYSNYKVVIIDDASTDHTYQLLMDLVSKKGGERKITLVRNQIQMTAVPNINKAIRQYCQQQDIVVLVDGDDELLVKDSLQVFNAVYQQKQAHVVYSNHIKLYWHENQVYEGWSAPYTDQQKTNNRYRQVPQKISHLRSFKAALYLQIKEQDLKDEHGSWLTSTYDQVICLPILEMACGRIEFIHEYFYLYNFGIGTNDLMVDGDKQKQIADQVRLHKKQYKCIDK